MASFYLRQVAKMLFKHIIINLGIFGLSAGLVCGTCAAQQVQPKQSFVNGMRHADIGEGVSRFSSFSAPKSTSYFVHCNCADLTSDTKICPTKAYQCVCSPASVYCQ